MKIKTKKHLRAESLIETIVAVTVIALGAVSVGIMVRTGLVGDELSQDRMFATNLAKEGIDAVSNIRDTNWLRYGLQNDDCWNTADGPLINIRNCDSSLIGEGEYVLKLNLEDDFFEYILVGDPGADIFDEEYLIYECQVEDLAAGNHNIFTNPTGLPAAHTCEETTFYRKIEITYDTHFPATAHYMTVSSEVGWTADGEQKTLELVGEVHNY
ncbi:hypothetical protein KJ764_04370 [Patescibacteria group bacterium]|nr:hypothetical protein [Patescibacteria group bacterium]